MKQKIYLVLAGLVLLSLQLQAQTPKSFNYQGVARDLSGNALVNQTISVRFSIHQGSAVGPSIYQETQLAETNQFGLFTLAVGEGTVVTGELDTIAWGKNTEYLEVEMDPNGGTSYLDMGTTQLLSVPYAFYAATSASAVNAQNAVNATNATNAINATNATNATNSIYSDTALFAKNVGKTTWTLAGTTIYNNNTGGVGVGTTTPSTKSELDVISTHQYGAVFNSDSLSNSSGVVDAAYTGTGKYNAAAVIGTSTPNAGYGYGGKFTGGRAGVSGNASSSGADSTFGVYGTASSATGFAYGTYGKATPVGAYGISSGTGVLFPELGSPYGQTTNTRVVGVAGEVLGGTAGGNYENDGVLGVATATGNYHEVGVCGYGTNATGSDIGVFGMGQGLGTENYVIAIYGYMDPAQSGGGVSSYVADYAGYFIGNVDVTGTFNVSGTKNFKIDDPLDPANKYLYHSCVESPDMMNIYNGDIITDAKGNATIALPQYFQAENKDYKYQLTVIGQFAQAIVATKIDNNQFTIKTNKPNVEVSWQVTGVRNDPYAKNNPTIPEVEKKGIEKGHYIFPQYYGQPQSLSIANLIGGPSQLNGTSAKVSSSAITPATSQENGATGNNK